METWLPWVYEISIFFLTPLPPKNLLCNLLYSTKPYTPSNYHLLHSVHSVAFSREAAPEAPKTVWPDRLEPGASRCPLVSSLTVISTEIKKKKKFIRSLFFSQFLRLAMCFSALSLLESCRVTVVNCRLLSVGSSVRKNSLYSPFSIDWR